MAVGAMARGADRAERVPIGFEPRPRRFEADAAAAGDVSAAALRSGRAGQARARWNKSPRMTPAMA